MVPDAIRLGDSDVVIAGGMENMSLAPYALPAARAVMRMGDGKAIDLMVFDVSSDRRLKLASKIHTHFFVKNLG